MNAKVQTHRGGLLPSSHRVTWFRELQTRALASLPRGRLVHKLLFLFLGLTVVPLFFARQKLIQVGNEFIDQESRSVRLAIAQKVATNVAGYMENLRNILVIVHKSEGFLAMRPAAQSEILVNVLGAYPQFRQISVINMHGRRITLVNRMGDDVLPGTEKEEREALRSTRALGDYISPVMRSSEGYPQVVLGIPIEKIPGRPVGVLVGIVNLVDLSSLVKNLKVGKSGYIYVVDMTTRRLVAHPDSKALLAQDLPSEVKAALLVQDAPMYGAFPFKDESNQEFLNSYAPVNDFPRLNWRVFVQQPIEEAYIASREMKRESTRSIIIVVIASLIVAVLLSQIVVRRVQRLQLAMEQVGEGNFDVPSVPISNDEFGSLTAKFLWMARSLKEKTHSLLAAQRELRVWNNQLETRVRERTHALQEAQEQLISQEKLAALGQMASVVGHELRNPLAVMNNSVYYLRTKLGALVPGSIDPKLEKHLAILEGEIVKSNTIIRDILDFARSRPMHSELRRLDELVEKAIERIQIPPNVTVAKNLQLENQQVPVDEDELRQVLVNLMENACQAMVSGGTLKVETRTIASMAEVRIGDSGCGIPQEHLAKIFAPFFTTKSRGTGLGLAVVKKIIDRHQGTIHVESIVGEGTTFIIRLPLDASGMLSTPPALPIR